MAQRAAEDAKNPEGQCGKRDKVTQGWVQCERAGSKGGREKDEIL